MRRKSFCLETPRRPGLNAGVMALPPPDPSMLDSLAAYPRWFVALCGTIVAAALIWIVMKLLKWSFYLLLAAVVAVGLLATIWLVFHR